MEVYERLLDLVGKPIDDRVLNAFIADVGQSPDKYKSDDDDVHVWFFPDLGFHIDFINGRCNGFAFHLATVANESGVKRYKGDFPAKIGSEDPRHEVERKLGFSPMRSNYLDSYSFPNYSVTFSFDEVTGGMRLLSVLPSENHSSTSAE